MEQNGLVFGKNDKKRLKLYGNLAITLENGLQTKMQGVGGVHWPSVGWH